MQFFSTLSVALLAATASAYEHRAAHARFHGRRDIGFGGSNSSSAAIPSTTPSPILSTGHETPAQPTSALNPGEETVTEIVDSTLTYTLGSGSTAQVVTTTVQHTTTRTVTHTLVLTRPPTATPSASKLVNVENNAVETPSTTIRQTSTITKVVTVYPAHPSGASANAAVPSGSAGCAGASTVYVTEQETVFVTLPASSASIETAVKDSVPTSAVHAEQPLQSSAGGYYPTGGDSNESGHAAPTGPVPTGYPSPYRFRNRR